jgi:hypothetical protein
MKGYRRDDAEDYTRWGRVTIQVEVTLSGSMLACVESILDALNEAGTLATRKALQRFDTDGARLELGGQLWFSKGRQPKYYPTPYGEVEIERHVYQRSHGGQDLLSHGA